YPPSTAAEQSRSAAGPVARRREARHRQAADLLVRGGDKIGRDAMARTQATVAVADQRLLDFDALLVLFRPPDGRGGELAFAEIDDETGADRDIVKPLDKGARRRQVAHHHGIAVIIVHR